MTYDDKDDLVKFSEKSYKKTVCPHEIAINVTQSISLEIAFDRNSSLSFVAAAK